MALKNEQKEINCQYFELNNLNNKMFFFNYYQYFKKIGDILQKNHLLDMVNIIFIISILTNSKFQYN